MKKLLLFLSLFLLIISFSNAQENSEKKAKYGLKTGLNLAVLSGTVNMGASFKPGMHFGGYIDITASKALHVQPELYFSSQGSSHDNDYKTNLNYLNIPFLFKIYAGEVFNFQLGPQLGLLLSAKYKNDSKTENVKDTFKGTDFCIAGGIGFDVSPHFNFGGRINYGISDIGNLNDKIGGMERPAVNNRGFHFFLGYSF